MSEAQPTVSVIIPTRNERDNVASLMERLEGALQHSSAELIFVDDSDDDTQATIVANQRRLPARVIHREGEDRRGGLSTAVVCGIRAARGTYLCVMDADLQHPPEKVPELLAKAEETGADVVLASRRREGASSVGLDGPVRKLLSLTLEWFTRLAFYDRLRGVDDPLSGFFVVRRSALEEVELRPRGYKISVEVLVRCKNPRVAHVPYVFMPRQTGTSKAEVRTGLIFLKHVAILFLEVPEARRFWKFGVVGASGFAIYLGLLWLLVSQVGLARAVGWAIAAEAAVIWNFLLNRSVTWSERRAASGWPVALEALRYHLTSGLSIATNAAVFFSLTSAGMNLLLAGFASIWAGVLINYLGADRFVFMQQARVSARGWLPWRRRPPSEERTVAERPAVMLSGDEEPS